MSLLSTRVFIDSILLNTDLKIEELLSPTLHPLLVFRLYDWGGKSPWKSVKDTVRVEYKYWRNSVVGQEINLPVHNALVKYGKILHDGTYYTRTEALVRFSKVRPRILLKLIDELDKFKGNDRIYYETKYLIYQKLSRDLGLFKVTYRYIDENGKERTTSRPKFGITLSSGDKLEAYKINYGNI